jgi:NAD+ diphosphatase
MAEIHPARPNPLTGNRLNRAGHLRRDEAWLAANRHAETARYLPIWRARNLMAETPDQLFRAVLLAPHELPAAAATAPCALLGLDDQAPVFAIDLSNLDEPLPPQPGQSFQDLRRVGGAAHPADASLMAHARGMMHWRTRHRFCGVCGAACHPAQAGHVMLCQGCGAHHFPRTDPAVIMLVTDGDRALLGMPTAFRDRRVFTTLAGFVEPGESLEEAVAREVFEETGVRACDVRYHSSQPWPFPSSLMLGFRATARSTEITIDPDEIADARWFTRDNLLNPDDFVLPPAFSIARRLIEDWIAE